MSVTSIIFLITILFKGGVPQFKLYTIGVIFGVVGWWRFRKKVLEDRQFYSAYFSMSEKERRNTPPPEYILKKKAFLMPSNFSQKGFIDMFPTLFLFLTVLNFSLLYSRLVGATVESFSDLLYSAVCTISGYLLFAFTLQRAINEIKAQDK